MSLQFQPPAVGGSHQRIQIKTQLLGGQRFQHIQRRNGCLPFKQLLQRGEHKRTIDALAVLHPNQFPQSIQKRTRPPAAQQLTPEAATGEHRSLEQTDQPLSALRREKTHPGGELRLRELCWISRRRAHEGAEFLHRNRKNQAIDLDLHTFCRTNRPRSARAEQQTAHQAHRDASSC